MGDTALVPDKSTVPMFWLMEAAVAPVTAHCNVAPCPEAMVLGLAVNDVTDGVVSPGVELLD